MDMKEMMGKKKAEKDPAKKDAKMGALKAMRQTVSDMMKGGMHDKMQKVSVMAKNPEDLEKGLETAKEIVGGASEASDKTSTTGDDYYDMPGEEDAEGDHYAVAEDAIDKCTDPEQLDALAQKIADKKHELMMKKA